MPASQGLPACEGFREARHIAPILNRVVDALFFFFFGRFLFFEPRSVTFPGRRAAVICRGGERGRRGGSVTEEEWTSQGNYTQPGDLVLTGIKGSPDNGQERITHVGCQESALSLRPECFRAEGWSGGSAVCSSAGMQWPSQKAATCHTLPPRPDDVIK